MLDSQLQQQIKECFEENGFVSLEGVLSADLSQYLKNQFLLLYNSSAAAPPDENIKLIDSNQKKSKGLYGMLTGESLTVLLTGLYSSITGKNLVPSYSYVRKYFKGNNLGQHIDRPACQYSATIMIDSDRNEQWPIYVVNPNTNEKHEFFQSPGDILFYKGEDVPHGRDYLDTHEWSSHIFMHWVDADDDNYNMWKYDSRPFLMMPLSAKKYS